jgi:hypothetical protein
MDIKRELLFYHETSSHLNKRIQKSHFLFRLSILNIHIITKEKVQWVVQQIDRGH